MLKIRRPLGRLIFNMGIAIPWKTVFLIETAPWYWNNIFGIALNVLLLIYRKHHYRHILSISYLVTIIARSLAVMVSGERQRASQVLYGEILYIEIRSWLSIKYTNMHKWPTHFFVTYECTKLLCVSLTRFYFDSLSFKENTYPVLNQRPISVDIRTAPFFTGANHARSRFSKPTLPQRAACCILSQVTFLLSPPGNVFQVSQCSRGFCLIPRSTLLTD